MSMTCLEAIVLACISVPRYLYEIKVDPVGWLIRQNFALTTELLDALRNLICQGYIKVNIGDCEREMLCSVDSEDVVRVMLELSERLLDWELTERGRELILREIGGLANIRASNVTELLRHIVDICMKSDSEIRRSSTLNCLLDMMFEIATR